MQEPSVSLHEISPPVQEISPPVQENSVTKEEIQAWDQRSLIFHRPVQWDVKVEIKPGLTFLLENTRTQNAKGTADCSREEKQEPK